MFTDQCMIINGLQQVYKATQEAVNSGYLRRGVGLGQSVVGKQPFNFAFTNVYIYLFTMCMCFFYNSQKLKAT